MGNTVTIIKGDVTEIYENVVGHQIGNGAIQILERSGNQRIIADFDDVTVTLDDESANDFAFQLEASEKAAEASIVAAEVAEDKVAEGDAKAEEVAH